MLDDSTGPKIEKLLAISPLRRLSLSLEPVSEWYDFLRFGHAEERFCGFRSWESGCI